MIIDSSDDGMVGNKIVCVKGEGTIDDCDKCIFNSARIKESADCSKLCTSREVSGGMVGVYFMREYL